MRSRLADGALVAHLANPRDGLSRTPVLWSYGEAANAPPWPGKGAKRPGRRRGPNRRNASTRPTTARSLLLVQSSSRRSTARSALGGFRSPWVSSHTGEARRRCWSGRVPPVILGRARVAARSRGRAEADRVPTAGASSLPFVAHLQTNRPLPLRTRTRHLIGGGRLPVAPGIAAVDQAWDETAGAERRSHTQQHGRDCRSGPAMQHSRGRRRPDRLIGSGASRDPDGSKHKSSGLDGARAAASTAPPGLLSSDTTSHRTTLVIPVRNLKASLGRRRRARPIRQAQVVGWVAAAALRSWWKRCCGLETTTGNCPHLETGRGGNNQDQRCC